MSATVAPLTDRQQQILTLIVEHYILTGEPVGSKTLVTQYGLPVSSATVRNVMAELEELGFLSQPHRSAGRVPTENAYRTYTRWILQEREERSGSRWEQLAERVRRRLIAEYQNLSPDEWEELFLSTCHILAQLSDYIGIVVAGEQRESVLERIDLVALTSVRLLAVLILRSGVVKQRMVVLEAPLSPRRVEVVAGLLNERFAGKTLAEIHHYAQELRTLWEMFEGEEREASIAVVRQAFSDQFDFEVYWEGLRNLVAAGELADAQRTAAVFETLESPEALVEAVGATGPFADRSGGLRVLIGSDIPDERLIHWSVVSAGYSLGEGIYGVVSVLGPMRMRYRTVIPLVEWTAALLGRFFEFRDSDAILVG